MMHIILADPHPHALWALKTTLQEKPEFDITGEAIDADGLLALVGASPPDLALIDGELPGWSMEDLITEVHACKPRPIVVLMSAKSEQGSMLLKAGADAFVSKSDQPDWLLETLQKYEKRFRKKKGD
jgi:DNA-binding NarL/FixJ family response regulator